MKYFIISCVFLLSFFPGISQVQVGTTVFEGRNVNIYPYRVSSNNYSTDNKLLGTSYSNLDIPYCPLSLPDGEYIAYYYKTRPRLKDHKLIYLKGDTDNVAICFFIQGNKKQGKAKWYTYSVRYKSVYQEGSYIDDRKEGSWIYFSWDGRTTYQYKNGLLDGEVKVISGNSKNRVTTSYHLSGGILNGKYIKYDSRKRDSINLEFANGMLTGEYYQVVHNSTLYDFLRPGGYERYEYSYDYEWFQEYDVIEIKGTLFNNLIYGKWDIECDKKRLTLVF